MDVAVFHPDFSTPSVDLIRYGAKSDSDEDVTMDSNDMQLQTRVQEACSAIDKIADDLKEKLKEQNEQFIFGLEKFISQYQNLNGSIPLLTSSLYCFVWTFGGSVTSRKGRHGRKISVQTTAAGRRKGTKSRGKARVTPGAPVKSAQGSHRTSNTHDPDYNTLYQQEDHQKGVGHTRLNTILKEDNKMQANGNSNNRLTGTCLCLS